MRSKFTYTIESDFIKIIDTCEGKSVTNDAENVIKDLNYWVGDIDQYVLIYCDSNGVWDRIITKNGIFSHFIHYNVSSFEEAKILVDIERQLSEMVQSHANDD